MTPKLPPSQATDAVFVQSAQMPQEAQKVEDLDFNKFKGRTITAGDLYNGMKHMGFQASSIGEAIRIINDMVCRLLTGFNLCGCCTDGSGSEHGGTRKPGTGLPFFLATLQT
jgi:hypothetical protein